MFSNYPKQIKRLINEYLGEAYERELRRELTKLDESFAQWRAGAIDSRELSYRVHQYEIGPSRTLYKRYNDGPKDMTLAYTIVAGILQPDEVPAELLEALERPLAFYQSLKARDQLREADDL